MNLLTITCGSLPALLPALEHKKRREFNSRLFWLTAGKTMAVMDGRRFPLGSRRRNQILAVQVQPDQHHVCDVDRRVGTRQNTDKQGNGEAEQVVATEEQQRR